MSLSLAWALFNSPDVTVPTSICGLHAFDGSTVIHINQFLLSLRRSVPNFIVFRGRCGLGTHSAIFLVVFSQTPFFYLAYRVHGWACASDQRGLGFRSADSVVSVISVLLKMTHIGRVRIGMETTPDQGIGSTLFLADEGMTLQHFDSSSSSQDARKHRRMVEIWVSGKWRV